MTTRTAAGGFKRRFFQRGQVGQAIILLALGMIVLLVFVGLVTDISLLFVRFSQLRRAIDAASIAAAGQIRENRDYADVAMSARQFIRLYGLDPNRVLVQTCATNPTEPLLLCPEVTGGAPRKLVRVIAQIDSPTTFLSLIGWRSITLEASAIAETAVLDVALVLDSSESMSQSTLLGHYLTTAPTGCDSRLRWGGCCNDPGTGTINNQTGAITMTNNAQDGDYSDLVCSPFRQVRDAARRFIQRLDFVRGDRVAYVVFNRGADTVLPLNPSGPGTLDPLITDENVAVETLNERVGVFVNPTGTWQGCAQQTGAWWISHGAEWGVPGADQAERWSYAYIAPCPQTNLGGGLLEANEVLTNENYVRRQAVWVIIVLSDGAANVTPPARDTNAQEVAQPNYGSLGYCPWYTFCDKSDTQNQSPDPNPDEEYCVNGPAPDRTDPNAANMTDSNYAHGDPHCTDGDPFSRHFCMNSNGQIDITDVNCEEDVYDAMDFAMDMADFSGLLEVRARYHTQGNFIAMYSIGFGNPGRPQPIPPIGEYMMRYIADAGDNGRIDNNYQQDCINDDRCGDEGGGVIGMYNPASPTVTYNPNAYDTATFGGPDPCEAQVPGNMEDCGQYWYADNPNDLERAFTEIASRLFTRLSR